MHDNTSSRRVLTIAMITLTARFRVVRVQTVMGRGFHGVHASVVELARLDYVVAVPVYDFPEDRRLLSHLLVSHVTTTGSRGGGDYGAHA